MKSAGSARLGQAGPSGTPAVCLGSAPGPGYRATVVCSHRLQSCRYFLTKFPCHTVCSRMKVYGGRHGKPSPEEERGEVHITATQWGKTQKKKKTPTANAGRRSPFVLISISVHEPRRNLKGN